MLAARTLAVAGAVALLVAEPLALMRVRTDSGDRVVRSVSAGAHHSYALVPLAALALMLVLVLTLARPAAARPAGAALVALGLAALGIALLGDLPDVHRSGVVGTPVTGLHNARTVAGPGLYIETLGAILLLAGGVTALVAALAAPRGRRAATIPSGKRRSVS